MRTLLVEFLKDTWTRNIILKDESGDKITQHLGMDYETYVKTFDKLVKKYKIQLDEKVIETAYNYGDILRQKEMTLQYYYTGE